MTSHPSTEFLALQDAVAGRYSVEREMGRGGMGIVFLARDVALERLVAVKLLPPHLATVLDARERFLREARTAGKLSHPNIVPIHAVRNTTIACTSSWPTSLEKIRLALLRLHAEVDSPEDLTAALEKAREVGDVIDAELEVHGALRGS